MLSTGHILLETNLTPVCTPFQDAFVSLNLVSEIQDLEHYKVEPFHFLAPQLLIGCATHIIDQQYKRL